MIFSEKFYIGYRDIDSNLKIKNSKNKLLLKENNKLN